MTRALAWRSTALAALLVAGCYRAKESSGIHVEKQDLVTVARAPRVVRADLSNPTGPRHVGDEVVVAQSGKGEIAAISRDGAVRPLITGFGKDSYAGYDISVQGLTVDSVTGLWIVCEAEGGGHVRVFDPRKFPVSAASGREIELHGDPGDNPYSVAITPDRRIVVAGGTKKVYISRFEMVVLPALESFAEVPTGIAGLRVDDRSGDVIAAVIGSGRGDGSIVRWSGTAGAASMATIAGGFTNLVDVAPGPNGTLLAVEFGDFSKETGDGKVWIVASDGSGRKAPLLTHLDRPSGIDVAADGSVALTDFGPRRNGNAGRLIDLAIAAPTQAR